MWQVAPRMGAVEEEAMDNKAIKEKYPGLDCLECISLATGFCPLHENLHRKCVPIFSSLKLEYIF